MPISLSNIEGISLIVYDRYTPSLLAFGCTLPNIILGTPTAELSYRVLLQETVQAPFFVTHVTAAVVVLAF